MVVILAAGRSSRMNLNPGESKCALPLMYSERCQVVSTVSRLILQMARLSPEREFVVVTGNGQEEVKRSVEWLTLPLADFKLLGDLKVSFVFNEEWDRSGSGMSLATGLLSTKASSRGVKDVYIFEGDSVYSDDNIKKILEEESTCCLVRRDEYLSDRSVAVLSHEDGKNVLAFVYDASHTLSVRSLRSTNVKIYDSMQIWKIHGYEDILDTELACDQVSHESTNVDPYNWIFSRADYAMKCIKSEDPEGWININTEQDFQDAQKLIKEDLI